MSFLLGAFLLASTVTENPRFVSPNGEMVVVVRSGEADVDTLPGLVPLPDEAPPEPKPTRGALYHAWPGTSYREMLSEFAFRLGENTENLLVTDDGHVVTHHQLQCGRADELLTIRNASGKVVRTLLVRDVLTFSDQRWLCRGSTDDVRYSIDGETLQMKMLVTDGRWDGAEARHRTVDIELATGAAPAPDRDHCPPAVTVVPEADEALLSRATVRVIPEYPEVAMKARISGLVGVKVVVGADGKVETATIVKPLPFGLDQAVHDAIVKWEFAPDAAPASGVIMFRFEILRPVPITTIH